MFRNRFRNHPFHRHCEEGALPDEAISWLWGGIASPNALAMTGAGSTATFMLLWQAQDKSCGTNFKTLFRHCEEGVLPDEAISAHGEGIASQRTLAMTECYGFLESHKNA